VRRLAALAIALALIGCGKEVGRVPFSQEGTGTVATALAAGDVALWSDLDVEYTGSGQLLYDVLLEQGGRPVGSATCDPLGQMPVKMSWVETNLGDSHSRRGRGKMTCKVQLAAGGATTVRARLRWVTRPRTLSLTRADLVIKQ
jgi:hypothetical protein